MVLKSKIIGICIACCSISGAFAQSGNSILNENDSILNALAKLHIEKQEFPQAENLLNQAIDIRKKKFGRKHPAYAESLNNLGLCHTYTGNFTTALNMLEEAENIVSNSLGKRHPHYADVLANIGIYYFLRNEFSTAEKYYTQSLEIYKATLGEQHSDYLSNVLGLSICKLTAADYNGAKQLIFQVLPVIEQEYGKEHPSYVMALSTLGSIYRETGMYEDAERVLLESLQVSEKIYGQKHTYFFNDLNSLATLYRNTGKYEKAEPLMTLSLKLRKELFGESHPGVASALNNLGYFYHAMGNYPQAERYFREGLEITKTTTGENSYNYISTLISLTAVIYTDHPQESLQLLMDKAPDVKLTFGENHLLYIQMQSQIADISSKLEVALQDSSYHTEALFLEILQKKKAIFGTEHIEYCATFHDLAAFYFLKGQYERAEELILQNINQLPDKNNPLYFSLLSTLALNQHFSGKTTATLQHYSEMLNIIQKKIEDSFAFLSEQEREFFWEPLSDYAALFHSFAAVNHTNYPAVTALSYNYELLSKSLLLNSSENIYQSILNNGDEKLIEMWEDVLALKKILLELKDLTSDKKQYVEEESDIQEYEKFIMSASKKYRKKQEFSFSWKDVQQALQADEAAIEFIHFGAIDIPSITFLPNGYYALLVRPDYEYPEMIYLCAESELETEQLYPLVWQPLEKYLQGTKNIYLSPSGLLCKVSFAGIKNGTKYLCDDYEIHHLLSTKDILNIKETAQHNISATTKQAVLFGGADFGGMLDTRDTTRGQGFSYLPGSEQEVKIIEKQLSGLNWTTSLFVDTAATETRFKALSSTQSPELLHISTHGFYFPQAQIKKEIPSVQPLLTENPNTYRISNHPLMRSGLAFTGANHVWSGKEPVNDADDGILTAYEVSNMNLGNTRLVVLSACETGLGDIAGGEGVYGLQRAFRLAGVTSCIVSLWDVPDKETVELMTEFYTRWNTTTGIHAAFSAAQQQLRKKYPDTPEKWAGFILIE